MTEFYLLRHGRTYLNEADRVQGQSDSPLTVFGQKEIARSGRGLSNIEFAHVYCSSLHRTRETAEIILAENSSKEQIEIIEMPKLNEYFFGNLEGSDDKLMWHRIFKHLYGTDDDFPKNSVRKIRQEIELITDLEGRAQSEKYEDFAVRIISAFQDIVRKAKDGEKILIISHGIVLGVLLTEIFPDIQIKDRFHNGSLTRIILDDKKLRIAEIDSVEHFENE